MRTLQWWAESDRVKVSENLGATSVAPVAPVDTSLILKPNYFKKQSCNSREQTIARLNLVLAGTGQNGNGVLNRVVSCLKCMELAC